jgi:hypothetical protein
VNPKVPIFERLIVVAILAGIGIVIVDFVRKGWKEFSKELAQFQARALCIAAGVSLVAFSVSLDRFQGFLRRTYGSASITAYPRRSAIPEEQTQKVAA